MDYQLLEELRKEYGNKFLEVLFKLYVVYASGRRILKLANFTEGEKDIIVILHPHFVNIFVNGTTVSFVDSKEYLIEYCKKVLPEWLNLNEKVDYLVNKYNKKLLSFVFWHLIKEENILFKSYTEKINKYLPLVKEFIKELERLKLSYFSILEEWYFVFPDLIEKIRAIIPKELAIKDATILFLLMEMENRPEHTSKELIESVLKGDFAPRYYFIEEYQQYFYSNFKPELIDRKILINNYLIWNRFIEWLKEKITNVKKELENESINEKLYQKIVELGFSNDEKGLLSAIFGEICTKDQFERFAIALYQIFHEKLRNKIKERIGEIDLIRNYFAHEKYPKLKEKFRDLCKKVLNKDYPENLKEWEILANYIKHKVLEKLL